MFNRQQCRTANNFTNKCGGWGRGAWANHWASKMQGFRRVPANIEETDNSFIISLFAAGLIKENISLRVKDDILTISYKGDDSDRPQQSAGDGFTYREYNNPSFERSFLLNNKVSTEGISAAYADGILKVTLPKNPETNKPGQTI